jgi:hypothetical protein
MTVEEKDHCTTANGQSDRPLYTCTVRWGGGLVGKHSPVLHGGGGGGRGGVQYTNKKEKCAAENKIGSPRMEL